MGWRSQKIINPLIRAVLGGGLVLMQILSLYREVFAEGLYFLPLRVAKPVGKAIFIHEHLKRRSTTSSVNEKIDF